jgi:hypothetical protein
MIVADKPAAFHRAEVPASTVVVVDMAAVGVIESLAIDH